MCHSEPVCPGLGRQDSSPPLPPIIRVLRNPVCRSINTRGLSKPVFQSRDTHQSPRTARGLANSCLHAGIAQVCPQDHSGKGEEALPGTFRTLGSQGLCRDTLCCFLVPLPVTAAPVPAQVCIHTCMHTHTHIHARPPKVVIGLPT